MENKKREWNQPEVCDVDTAPSSIATSTGPLSDSLSSIAATS